MNCRDSLRVLNGYVDVELDLTATLAMEQHLQSCRRCRSEEATLRALRAAVRQHNDADATPAAVRARLHAHYGVRRAPVLDRSRRRVAWAVPAAAAVLLAGTLGFKERSGDSSAAESHAKVVYHIAQSDMARAALRTLGNHLEAAPGVQVVVVAHNNGVEFLLRGARDESGAPYEETIRKFAARGVQFRVCNNTLVRQHIAADRVVPEATLIPSGIAEIGRLQSAEGYAYMRL